MARSKKEEAQSAPVRIDISTNTIIRFLVIGLVLVLLYVLRDIVAIFLISLLLATLIDPFADWANRFHLPRGLSVLIVYICLLSVAAGAFVLVIPSVLSQFSQALQVYGGTIQTIVGSDIAIDSVLAGDLFSQDIDTVLASIKEVGLSESLEDVFSLVTGFFGSVFAVFLILILAFYMVVEEGALHRAVMWLTPPHYHSYVRRVAPKARKKIGDWLRAQLLLMVIIFLITYAGLLILGVPYALTLAFLAGLLEIVPFLGPTIASIPAALIALSVSPVHALLTLLLYVLIQQLEGDILTPKIMQKIGGLNPILSILALLVGFQVAGPLGAILAIPLTMVLGVYLEEWFSQKK